MEKALEFCLNLSVHVSTLRLRRVGPTGRISVVQLTTTLWQPFGRNSRAGPSRSGGVVFNGEDACIAFLHKHLMHELTYHCIPSLMFAMCMPSEEVIYKDDIGQDACGADVTQSHAVGGDSFGEHHNTTNPGGAKRQ